MASQRLTSANPRVNNHSPTRSLEAVDDAVIGMLVTLARTAHGAAHALCWAASKSMRAQLEAAVAHRARGSGADPEVDPQTAWPQPPDVLVRPNGSVKPFG
jgi:hypothetical protein